MKNLFLCFTIILFGLGNMCSSSPAQTANNQNENENPNSAASPDSLHLEYYNKAWDAFEEYDFPLAMNYLHRANDYAEEHFPQHYKIRIGINELLGSLYDRIGFLKESMALFLKNLEWCTQLDDREFILDVQSIAYTQIASNYSRMKNWEKALEYYFKGYYIDMNHFPDNYYYHYVNHRNIGIMYTELSDFELAEEHLSRALDLASNPQYEIPVDHRAFVLLNLAELYLKSNRIEMARNYLDSAIQTMEDEVQSGPADQFLKSVELSMQLFLIDGEVELALGEIDRVKGYMEKVEIPAQSMLCPVYNLGAELMLDNNQPQKAIDLLQLCLLEHSLKGEINFSEIQYTDEVIKVLALQSEAQIMIAIQMEGEERINALKEVVTSVENATEMLREFISGIFISEAKARFISEHMRLFQNGIEALYHLHQITGNEDYVMEAFIMADQSRSAVLLEEVLIKMTFDKGSKGFFQEDLLLRNKSDSLELELLNLDHSKAEAERQFVAIKNELASLQDQRKAFFEAALSNQPHFLNQMVAGRNVNKTTIENILEKNWTLLSHFIGEEELYVMALSNRGFQLEKLEVSGGFRGELPLLRSEIQEFPSIVGDVENYRNHEKRYRAISDQLYSKLIAPVEEVLTNRLLIVPVDEISVVPFGAIITGENERENRAEYLIEKIELIYAYSLKTLEILKESWNEKEGGQMAVFAPNYHHEEVVVAGIRDTLQLLPLKYNQAEGEFLRSRMNAEVYAAERANLVHFKESARNSELLHISGHALSNDQFPEYSFLAFSRNPQTMSAEILPFVDIEKMEMNARMVFLNGCLTGYGPIQRGEGTQSLQRAFASAGVNSLLTTLWPVNDHSAYKVTEGFYNQLQKGKNIPQSLQKAALQLINSGDPVYSHPYHWAGYTAYGDWRNPIDRSWNPKVIIGLYSFIALLVLLFGLWKYKLQ